MLHQLYQLHLAYSLRFNVSQPPPQLLPTFLTPSAAEAPSPSFSYTPSFSDNIAFAHCKSIPSVVDTTVLSKPSRASIPPAMATNAEESISLTSRGPYLDDANAQSDPRFSASDTLLEDDIETANDNIHQRPSWRRIFSFKNVKRSLPRSSRAAKIISEKTMIGGRKRSRICLKAALGILVFL